MSKDGQYQLFGDLRPEEFSALEKDIIARGVMVPVEVDENGVTLDGHNRIAIAKKHGLPYKTIVRKFKSEGEKREHVIKLNLCRRHLDPLRWGQAFKMLLEERGAKHGKGAGNRHTSRTATVAVLAKEVGVTVRTAERRLAMVDACEKMPEPLKEKVIAGTIPLKVAERQAKRAERIEQAKNRPEVRLDSGNGKYHVIYADPPWQYDFATSDARKIENQYETMTVEQICALAVPTIAEVDSVLFLWATSPKLLDAIRVMAAWDFTYKTSMVWVKDKIGMGYYARQRHELLLIGTRGNLPVPDPENRPDSVIEAPRLAHSEKPSRFHEVIEAMYPSLARVELFARKNRDGWTAWGDQACR
jgi:N6-adenosine-specific RNA methylase IME4